MDTKMISTTTKVRPDYKALPEIQAGENFTTHEQLSKDLLVSKLQVALALKEANVYPFARKFEIDAETGKKKRGAPTLCFEPTVAKGAVLAKYSKKSPSET